MSSKIPNDQPSQKPYALGWERVYLPGNEPDWEQSWITTRLHACCGQKGFFQLVYFHCGSGIGNLSIVILHPKQKVLLWSNKCARSQRFARLDWTTGIGRVSGSLGFKEKRFVQLAKASAAKTLKWYPNFIKELKELKKLAPYQSHWVCRNILEQGQSL
jgi:hypothetical protein